MPLTRDFRETVMARVKSEPAFRGELIVEATIAFLVDDMETGKALLRVAHSVLRNRSRESRLSTSPQRPLDHAGK